MFSYGEGDMKKRAEKVACVMEVRVVGANMGTGGKSGRV